MPSITLGGVAWIGEIISSSKPRAGWEKTMEKRAFGKTGMQVSVLGFGGAEIGYQNVDASIVERLLKGAFYAGLNIIDTAECYGVSEDLIGITVSSLRDQFYIFTKVGHSGFLGAPDWTAGGVEKSIDRSLKRMKTDHVDLVQLHSCDKKILERGDVIGALQKARQAGKTRFIGYSGDGEDALCAVKMSVFDSLQTSLNIADQESIDLTIPLAVDKGMGIIAKRPLANMAWRLGSKPVDNYSRPYWERLNKLKYDFLQQDLNAAAEVALRFVLNVTAVSTAIAGTTKPERWQENARTVAKGPLPEPEFEAIRKRWLEVKEADWVGQV